MRLAPGRGMAGASNDERARPGGRPRLPPIGLLPPDLVPMTAPQREIAIQTLAVLLDSWLKGERTVRTAGKLPVNRRSALKSLSDGRVSSLKSDA
jgi:hypothetical protein